MSTHNPSDVSAAYEMLLEELESEIDWVNSQGAAAFHEGDHRKVATINERAKTLEVLHADLVAFGTRLRDATRTAPVRPRVKSTKLARGLKTPQHAYRVPILNALIELGGSADISQVLDRVYAVVRDDLNEYDFSTLPSDPDAPRWRNTAQWARNSMREEGLMADDSHRGIWEITDAGRAWLAEQTDAASQPPDGDTAG